MFPFVLLSLNFVQFPSRADTILKDNHDLVVEASGSIGLYRGNKCDITYPNMTLNDDKHIEWCSNIGKGEGDNPWIMFSVKNKAMKLTGYTLRTGCCYYACCCYEEGGSIRDIPCCCNLYTFSLIGSNDNKTWKTIHHLEKVSDVWGCKTVTYSFEKTEGFRYIRFVQEKEYPYCPKCMQLNQFELYGETFSSPNFENLDDDENEDSVSIIGKIKSEIN